MIDFSTPYSREIFLRFLQDTFLPDDFFINEEELSVDFRADYIQKVSLIGKINSLNLKLYEVLHESEFDPRVSLTKESFRLMASYATRRALVIFVSKNSPNYRFSLITIDLKLKGSRVTKEFSNPRRYSFFLGLDAKTHTPSRFLIKEGRVKDFEDLRSRFNVEIVTKEFFSKYKNLFDKLSGYLKKDWGFKQFAQKNNINIDTFAKKLLGQVVFIYFLQRKGWVGATRDSKINEGDKNFVRNLFNRCIKEEGNFFNDYLEPLFYDAFNKRPDYSASFFRNYFDCQIPFLNGGLFEPLNNYDWKNSFIHIPNKIFSANPNNSEESEGVLDVFDLYNFTIHEDDPIDREVSIDPEMLGKVFENLLEENLRKGKGTYYTPREIVHYMCEESLVNYLASEIGLEPEETRKQYFPAHYKLGDERAYARDVTTIRKVVTSFKNIKVVDPACGSGAFLVGILQQVTHLRYGLEQRLALLDGKKSEKSEYDIKKETIQNCIYGVDIDPGAVEIAKLRLWLSLIVDYNLEEIEPLPNLDYKIMAGNSLIEDIFVNGKRIKLFDYLFFQRKREKKYINLFEEDLQADLTEEIHWKSLHQEIEEIVDKKKEIFITCEFEKKQQLREEVNKLENKLIRKSLKKESQRLKEILINEGQKSDLRSAKQNKELLNIQFSKNFLDDLINDEHRLNDYKSGNLFLWKLRYIEVFDEKGGFDIILANPPYVGEKDNKELFQVVTDSSLGKRFYLRRMDLFYFFFHLSLDLLHESGLVCFITTNYYITATGGKKLRDDIKDRAIILKLINFNELRIFDSARGQHNMITLLQKNEGKEDKKYLIAHTCITSRDGLAGEEIIRMIIDWNDDQTEYYRCFQKDIFEGVNNYIRYRSSTDLTNDPKQVLNNNILEKIQTNSVTVGEICDLNQGIVSGADKVTKSMIKNYADLDLSIKNGIFVLTEKEIYSLELPDFEFNKFVKPFYKNSDIYKWVVVPNKKLFILYIKDEGQKITLSHNLNAHFEKYKQILIDKKKNCFKNKWLKNIVEPWLRRGNYFVLFYPRSKSIFEDIKIVNSRRAKKNIFALEDNQMHEQSDIVITTLKNEKKDNYSLKFILGLLNSKLYFFWMYHKGKRKGEMLELFQKPLSEIPIKKISLLEQQPLVSLVNKILIITKEKDYLNNSSKQAKVSEYEKQIDQMVYKLYGLTPEEISIIEQSTK